MAALAQATLKYSLCDYKSEKIKMNCELMLTYDTPLFGKQEVGI